MTAMTVVTTEGGRKESALTVMVSLVPITARGIRYLKEEGVTLGPIK